MSSGEGGGSLRLVRRPVEWDTFDLVEGDDQALRLYFVQGAGGRGGALSNADVAEVLVIEDCDVIAITLVERHLEGTYPDGHGTAEPLAAMYRCVELGLEAPLGIRKLIDGSTGNHARRLRRRTAQDEDDASYMRAEEHGCPRWIA